MKDKKIVFENGREFYGKGFGADVEKISEVVFNTSMVGYQEILSDPSYYGQMVVMTYPLIGNYGITDEDFETKSPNMGGFIVGEYNDKPSNYRYTRTLSDIMVECGIPGIWGLDTRAITRMIRSEGSMRVIITDADVPYEEALAKVRAWQIPTDHVSHVACKKMWHRRTPNFTYNVVAVDCGIKHNIIRWLNKRGCNVTIVPPDTSFETVMELEPDGVFFSNGPGNPVDNTCTIELINKLWGKVPMFGICLGDQMICLARGAKTFKMKFGHRGGNHPVKNLFTKRVEITSQNHSFAVDVDSLKDSGLELTHINVLDGTCEDVRDKENFVFCVQYHPESAPGPQDSDYLFDQFNDYMNEFKKRGDK